MPVRSLLRRHDEASRTKYQELKQLAGSQTRILRGTPGTLKQWTQSGNKYWVREHIRTDGKKDDEYIGAESAVGKARIDELSNEIELARSLATESGKLRLLGYQRIDRRPAAVLEVFFNHGLNRAGLTLIGSHAYGVLLNELGISAPAYRTQDLDVARARPLGIALAEGITFEHILKETGLEFRPVPGMPSHRPSTSFKLPGAGALAVDLLVPGPETGKAVAASELGAHAQSIPLLDFLIDEPIESVVLSPNQVIPVKVPSPERFALHKLFSSQSRKVQRDKVRKDLDQAAVLVAVVEEDTPELLLETFRLIPAKSRSLVKRGASAAAGILAGHHAGAEAVLRMLAKA